MTLQSQILSKLQTTRFRNLKQSKFRKQDGLFLLEGVRLCNEAFKSSLQLEACIIQKGFNKLSIPENLTLFEATSLQIQQITDSKNPQGIVCIARIPASTNPPIPESGKVLLVLDRITDPGNLGTIFRSALWFGLTDILLGPGCVDPYSPKAVRSSMGAIASLRIHSSDNLKTSATTWKQAGGELAALHMTGNPIKKYFSENGLFLIVGSEAHGVDPDLLKLSSTISIAKPGSGESLNAAMATSIALYELIRN